MSGDQDIKVRASQPEKKQESFAEVLRTVFFAVLIAVCLRTLAYEPFVIPSGSMLPTLLIGDYLFVSKSSYGYSRYSMPFGPPLFSGRILESKVRRGDVVVFKKPSDNATDYIKRIVGLPGDRLQMRQGQLFINDVAVKRTRQRSVTVRRGDGTYRSATLYIETLPNGVSHRTLDYGERELDNTPVYVVPAGHYFGMGDNRDDSTDSRVLSEVGYIPAENLIGRAEFFFFSINHKASWWQVWRWPEAIRFDRIIEGVDYFDDQQRIIE